MRWALAILISLNVVLFLWIQLGPNREEPVRVRQLPDFGDVRLLHESDKEAGKGSIAVPSAAVVSETAPPPVEVPLPAPAEGSQGSEVSAENTATTGFSSNTLPERPIVQPSPPAETANSFCGELGPFPSRNMAEGYLGKLVRDSKVQAVVEVRPGKEVVGYWVMIPPSPDIHEAEAMLKKLREAGFKDLWLMRKGEHANGISMGLYTEARYARRHGESIRKKGFETVIVPKQKKARRYWLVFSDVSEKDITTLQNDKLPQGVELMKKPCL